MNYIPTTVRDHFIEKQGNASRNHPVVPVAIGISIEPESMAGKLRLSSAPFYDQVGIEALPTKDKECLLLTVDNFIKATKLNML